VQLKARSLLSGAGAITEGLIKAQFLGKDRRSRLFQFNTFKVFLLVNALTASGKFHRN